MKTKKLMIALAGFCLLFLLAGPVMAAGEPSAKFAAFWTETPGLESVVNITDASADTPVALQSRNGYTLATIKVPQAKELLVGVSAEIGLVTFTGIKGKNGGAAISLAGAEAFVTVAAVPRGGGQSIQAAPGPIMLSKRVQELTATLGGVIQSCQVTCAPGTDPDTGEPTIVCEDINIADDCVVTDEQIALLLDTTAAHHFNFVLPDVPVGVYDIKAFFTTGARAKVDICDPLDTWCTYDPEGTVSASANAKAVINKTMLTVQQVRAAKGGAEGGTIIIE